MKKIIAITTGCILVMILSVGATLAWLTDTTDEVKNTFTSAALFEDPENDFTLWEHRAVDADIDGRYELTAEKVTSNTYEILPGVDIPKDPTVDVEKLEEYGYLYITVENALPAGLSYTIDSANWEQLDGYTGVWVYKGEYADGNVIRASDDAKISFKANILTNMTVEVSELYDPDKYSGTVDDNFLKFNAYMVQATGNGANAAEAWGNTFGK